MKVFIRLIILLLLMSTIGCRTHHEMTNYTTERSEMTITTQVDSDRQEIQNATSEVKATKDSVVEETIIIFEADSTGKLRPSLYKYSKARHSVDMKNHKEEELNANTQVANKSKKHQQGNKNNLEKKEDSKSSVLITIINIITALCLIYGLIVTIKTIISWLRK